ncbi:MAG: hypothetical protein RJA99_3312 [Pseudomonadota bacterium]
METLDERWDALGVDAGEAVYQLIDASHPLRFYIGISAEAKRQLLLVSAEQPAASVDYQHLRIQSFQRADGLWSLILQLEDSSLEEVFATLCEDLVVRTRHLKDPERPIRPLMRRLVQWLDLLAKRRSATLSTGEIRGLAGELLALHSVVRAEIGLPSALRAWTGPQGADQDFRTPSKCWEVKTVQPAAAAVQISSEDQLDIDGPAELVVIILDESEVAGDDTFTLNALVAERRAELSADIDLRDLLDDRLIQAGYLPRPEYDLSHFTLMKVRRFSVSGDFPRLRRSTLAAGIESLSYSIRLDALGAFELPQT